MCDNLGISDTKISVWKIIDDNTAPGGVVYNNIDNVMKHFESWIETSVVGEEFDFKVIVDKMTESEFDNLPEFED